MAEQQLQLRFPVLLQVLGTTACGYAASPREATGTASDSTPSPAELDELNTADPNLQLQTLQTQQLSQEARYAQADQTPDPTVGLRMAQEQNNAERIVGLQLSIPLSGQLRQAQTRLAQQTFAVADQSLRVVQQEQRLQLQQLFINLPALRIQAERLGQLAVRSRAALTKAERAFRLGESNITEITLLKQQHLRVELDAVDAHYTWLQSQVRLWALQEAAKLNNETTVKAQ